MENWRIILGISFTVFFIALFTMISILKERKSYKFKKGDIVVMVCDCYNCTDFQMIIVSRKIVNAINLGDEEITISNGYYCRVIKEGMKNKTRKVGKIELVKESDLKLFDKKD